MALLSDLDHKIRDHQMQRKAQKLAEEQRRKAIHEARQAAERRARLRREEGYL
jgi:hypothetical protein